MRELEHVIDKALLVGLSPFDITPPNVEVLSECLGFRLDSFGLEPYKELTYSLVTPAKMDYVWPFPQYIVGDAYEILVVRNDTDSTDYIYFVSDNSATLIATLTQATYGVGGLMEVADFGQYIFMTNGKAMVYYDIMTSTWQDTDSISTIPLMKTVCNYKGQAFGGGVLDDWPDASPYNQCDDKYYVWSKIGSIDFTPDRYNTSGFRRCPYGGSVQHTRRLRDIVVGYSSKGITAFSPVPQPAPTFKTVEMHDVGIINQGAMDGNLDEQVYIGKDYRIYKVMQQEVKNLGYRQSIEKLAGEDIIVQFDKNRKDYYIGNSSKTFLLTQKGLTEIPQHPSAVYDIDGTLNILPNEVDDYKALITSEKFNMGYSGQKTIFSIETDAYPVSEADAAIEYSLNSSTSGTTQYVSLNNERIASIIAAGTEFKVKLRFDHSDSTRISYVKARFKMTDLRGLRGVYAPPPRGQ